ncbi:MAG: FhaA domain-containing protein [Nocardioidaceae bacterium]
MGALHRFEQQLEHLVTGAFARAFRSAVQPVEIASALQREIDNSAQILSRDRLLVPNAFTVELAQSDYDRLAPYGSTLSGELGALVKDHVAQQHYTLAGPLSICFEASPGLTTGRFRVRSRANAAVTPVAAQRMTETAVRRAPVILEVNGMQHPVEPPGVVVGRGSEADLRISDPGVSRRHVEIRLEVLGNQLLVSAADLGSTNGTTIDGRRVPEARLHDGSQILIGTTTLTVRDPSSVRAAGAPGQG